MVLIYLDDILILANSEHSLKESLQQVLLDLEESGMNINVKKSVLTPSQHITHLGFQLNLKEGRLEVPKFKIKSVKKELGKFLVNTHMTCRKTAAILGQVRSFLAALPFLRAFTDEVMNLANLHKTKGWDAIVKIPPSLRTQVKEIGELLDTWQGRKFEEGKVHRKVYSDSSQEGWGAMELVSGQKVQEFWRSERGLHINIKELKAAISAVRSFAKQGETVHLPVDNQVAYYYLKKGGGN